MDYMVPEWVRVFAKWSFAFVLARSVISMLIK